MVVRMVEMMEASKVLNEVGSTDAMQVVLMVEQKVLKMAGPMVALKVSKMVAVMAVQIAALSVD